jgi:hypothetical protein
MGRYSLRLGRIQITFIGSKLFWLFELVFVINHSVQGMNLSAIDEIYCVKDVRLA